MICILIVRLCNNFIFYSHKMLKWKPDGDKNMYLDARIVSHQIIFLKKKLKKKSQELQRKCSKQPRVVFRTNENNERCVLVLSKWATMAMSWILSKHFEWSDRHRHKILSAPSVYEPNKLLKTEKKIIIEASSSSLGMISWSQRYIEYTLHPKWRRRGERERAREHESSDGN